MLASALIQYQTNNHYHLPIENSSRNYEVATFDWFTSHNFYTNYLKIDKEAFIDPKGTKYTVAFSACNGGLLSSPTSNYTKKYCTGYLTYSPNGGAGTITGTSLDNGHLPTKFTNSYVGGVINIIIGAKCDGEATVPSNGKHSFAIMYPLEGNGTYCVNN